jgi:hypothetical protein
MGLLDSLGSSGNGGLFDFLGGIFGPQQANAQPLPGAPAAGQVPGPAQPPPQFVAPRAEGLGRLTSAIGGFLNGGSPIGGALNALTTLATGEVTDPREIARAQMINAYRSLQKDFGLSEPQARMVVNNPAIMKEYLKAAIVPEYKFEQAGQYYGRFNPSTGRFDIQGASPKFEKVSPGETGGYATPDVPVSPTAPIQPRPVPTTSYRPGGPAAGVPTAPVAGQPNAGGFKPIMQGGPKFDDISSLRKEITALPEVKRFTEAKPVFQSMIESHSKDTAAADLDFVYGVAKIFDPDSVVREGEMKLVGQAQSIPEDIQGWIKRVAFGEGRLTPEARARILEVARIRMGQLQKAYQDRTGVYPDIAARAGIKREDIMPGVDDRLPDAPVATKPPAASIVPPEVRSKPVEQQMREAPDGSIIVIQGKRQIKRNGRWELLK